MGTNFGRRTVLSTFLSVLLGLTPVLYAQNLITGVIGVFLVSSIFMQLNSALNDNYSQTLVFAESQTFGKHRKVFGLLSFILIVVFWRQLVVSVIANGRVLDAGLLVVCVVIWAWFSYHAMYTTHLHPDYIRSYGDDRGSQRLYALGYVMGVLLILFSGFAFWMVMYYIALSLDTGLIGIVCGFYIALFFAIGRGLGFQRAAEANQRKQDAESVSEPNVDDFVWPDPDPVPDRMTRIFNEEDY